MKAEEIIKALVARLPALTDKFSEQTVIDTITSSGLVATATISAGHGRVDGELVTIVGSISPISITSIIRTDDKATVITSTNHDFTLSPNDTAHKLVQNVILSGANEAEFNGTFVLSSVTNRKEFIIDIADAGPASATGTLILENGANELQGYNVSANITVVSSTVFTYPIQAANPNAAAGSPIMHAGHRVTGSVTIEDYLDAYTKQPTDKLWCIVVLGDVIASKGRENRSDSTDRFSDNQHYKQEITQPFGVYIVTEASSSIVGRTQRDDMEDIVPLILKSVLLEAFASGFSANKQNRATFNAHGFFFYNGPIYVHEITFEQNLDLLFDDSIGDSVNVAFRDITLTINNDLGTGEDPQTATINLDESP